MTIHDNLCESTMTYDNLLDNEREGAEIGLPMPIQFNKIPN